MKQQRGDAPSTVVQDGTFGGNAYDFYCYFENDIFRNASDEAPGPKRDVNEREEEALAESHAKVLAEKQDRLAFFGFQRLTWQQLDIWMHRNWAQTRNLADPS